MVEVLVVGVGIGVLNPPCVGMLGDPDDVLPSLILAVLLLTEIESPTEPEVAKLSEGVYSM